MAVSECEGQVFAVALEQPRARAGDHRVDEQLELIEQALAQQGPHEGAARPTVMSLPGCSFSLARVALTSPLITVVGPQSALPRVLEMTILGVFVISGACGGAAGPVNTPRNSS